MSNKHKMLIVRLMTDTISEPFLSHGVYDIKSKNDTEYMLDVEPGNLDYKNSPRKVISIKDVGVLKYSEFFIHTVDCDVHNDVWHVNGYVYQLLNDEQAKKLDLEVDFWKHQLFKMIKRSLKNRNKQLKEIYYQIDDLSFTEGDAKSWVNSR